MSNQLAVRPQSALSMTDIERAAAAMSKSGYFQDAKDAAQSVVKILAGQEMGFGPFASMTGIYIIQGRPSVGANLMAAAVKSSGRYNYRVAEMTDAACEIIFFEQGQECGRSRFTIEDARKAQTKNLDKFPRNMLFARAMSNGCRWYCPDIFAGAPTYTPEELGADVDQDGQVINAPVTIIDAPKPAHRPEAQILREIAPAANAGPAIDSAQDAPAEWDSAAVNKLAAELHQAAQRIINALAYSNLVRPSTYDQMAAWIAKYRKARDMVVEGGIGKMTVSEAGDWANSH